ncbi:MAG TPA: hypothetical protein VJB70_03595 [Candidatus Paceibacterota bacterium]
MKLYTAYKEEIGRGAIHPGIELDEKPGHGVAVVVGDYGFAHFTRGKIALCKKYPPKVTVGAHLLNADLVRIHGAQEFWVLREERTQNGDKRALVLISCEGDVWSNRPGIWCTLRGKIDVVATGRIAGDPKRGLSQVYYEDLVVMYLDSSALVQFMGDPKQYILSYTDPEKGPEINIIV